MLSISYLQIKYNEDLALNNLQWLIYHKNQPANQFHQYTESHTYIHDDCIISTDDCCLKFQSLKHLYIIGFKWCKLVPHLHHFLGFKNFKNYDLVTSRYKMTGSYFSCRFYIGVSLLLYELPSLRLRSPVCPFRGESIPCQISTWYFLVLTVW